MGQTMTIDATRRGALLVTATAALLLAFLVLVQPALANDGFVHRGATCDTCHGSALSDATCTQCHTTFSSRQAGATTARTCWTCHDSAADLSAVQGASCGTAAAGAGCHGDSGHFGSNTQACTTACHDVLPASSSVHHTEAAFDAPTCADCHGSPDSLHNEIAVGVGCGTCHGGYDSVHPDPTKVMAPTVALAAKPTSVKYGLTTIVSGSVKYGAEGAEGLVGSTVKLQAKPFGATTYAGVAETTTGVGGAYAFVAQSPTLLTSYRLVAAGGVVGPTIVKPSMKTLDVKVYPALTMTRTRSSFALGGKQTIKGTLNPARPGGAVKLTIQRKVSGTWKTQLTKSRALTAASGYTAYSYVYKPLKKGSWRVKATIPATPELAAFTTAYKIWVVK